jgi:hypothetical protein
MPTIRSFGFIIIAGFLICSETYAAIELVERWRFAVPEVTGIDQISLKDINNDGSPEALARRGRLLILFSPSQDLILFRDSLDGDGSRAIYLGDINRDSVADIVSGLEYGNSIGETDTAVAIDLYDGKSDYSISRTYYSNSYSVTAPGGFFLSGLEAVGMPIMGGYILLPVSA